MMHAANTPARPQPAPQCMYTLSPATSARSAASTIASKACGNVRGAFTGATEDKPGYLGLADGGAVRAVLRLRPPPPRLAASHRRGGKLPLVTVGAATGSAPPPGVR